MNNILKIEFYGLDLEFNIEKMMVDLKWKEEKMNLPLSTTVNKKIHKAFLDDTVYLNVDKKTIEEKEESVLYYCSRNIMTREIGNNNKMYMDLLMYNSDDDILYPNALNRSLGHCNDVMEYEVHQVMSGEILSIFKSPEGDVYYGFFKEGDYLEIPAGWFHCTYVTKKNTVVANYYCNAYWEDNIDKKPYFDVKNNICIEKGEVEGEYVIIEKGNEVKEVVTNANNDELKNLNMMPYSKLFELGILKRNYKEEERNIFDLFTKIEM